MQLWIGTPKRHGIDLAVRVNLGIRLLFITAYQAVIDLTFAAAFRCIAGHIGKGAGLLTGRT
jgi:hypothetical protein